MSDFVKLCVGCNNVKSTDEFYIRGQSNDGFSVRCKECLDKESKCIKCGEYHKICRVTGVGPVCRICFGKYLYPERCCDGCGAICPIDIDKFAGNTLLCNKCYTKTSLRRLKKS
jgi:hypothetical protein